MPIDRVQLKEVILKRHYAVLIIPNELMTRIFTRRLDQTTYDLMFKSLVTFVSICPDKVINRLMYEFNFYWNEKIYCWEYRKDKLDKSIT